MWQDIIQVDQIVAGEKIRKIILEGNDQHETIYNISRVGDHYFFIKMIENNGNILNEDQQIVLPYKLANTLYHGFQIWREEDIL